MFSPIRMTIIIYLRDLIVSLLLHLGLSQSLTVGLADVSLVLRPLDYVTKLVSGLLACELPLDGNPVAIHTTIPGPSLLAQASDVSDSAFA